MHYTSDIDQNYAYDLIIKIIPNEFLISQMKLISTRNHFVDIYYAHCAVSSDRSK